MFPSTLHSTFASVWFGFSSFLAQGRTCAACG